jgi:hypothetical protein
MRPKNFSKVVRGKRYSVTTSTLLASNEYWDGSNFDRGGRNTFLYRTKRGAYFQVNLTKWQGERDTLVPLSKDEAKELWEHLPEKSTSYQEAFDEAVEDA